VSLVVVCDKCGKTIGDEQNRVVLTAVLYTLADQDSPAEMAPPPSASAPPGTPVPVPGAIAQPMGVTGSSRQFTTSPAFDGQMEMHEDCWHRWMKGEEDPPAASISREESLARQAEEREEDTDDEQ
jgi:hypothetical protein